MQKKNRERDVTETLYVWWKEGKNISIPELCVRLDISKEELTELIAKMEKSGYIAIENRELRLTSTGLAEASDAKIQQNYLMQLFQNACNMDLFRAKEKSDAMMEQLSREELRQIYQYLREEKGFDRTLQNFDLIHIYGKGKYSFRMGIYYLEQRNPRKIAEEFWDFSEEVCLVAASNHSYFQLKRKEVKTDVELWYRKQIVWVRAEQKKNSYLIPTSEFTFTFGNSVSVAEGDLIITFVLKGQYPDERWSRELNVHIW